MRALSTLEIIGPTIVVLALMAVTLAGLLLAACGTSQPDTFTIGVVNLAAGAQGALDGFKEGLAELGYVAGENLTYIYDGTVSGAEALEPAVQRLVEKGVDLILSLTTPATIEARLAVEGTNIPVVFVLVYDPVSSGVVDSLIKPGGDLTGIRGGGHMVKMLDWLLRIAPDTKRCFAPYNPEETASVQALAELEKAAGLLGVDLVAPEVRTSEELSERLSDLPLDADAIIVLPGAFFLKNLARLEQTAIDHELPLVSGPAGSEAPMLITYGADVVVMGKQASRLAAKILMGTAPADLPVETADFFLGINLRTAQAIGVDISDDILQQADTIVR